MRTLSLKRVRHFVSAGEGYTVTISDALGIRRVKIENGKTLELPTDDGEVVLTVSADTVTGYAESKPFTVKAGGNAALKIETGYSLYTGATLKIKRTDDK